jgi:hypothetical protein
MALFRGGVPTGMDVDRLMKEIEISPGAQVDYSKVETILGVSRANNRFRSVTTAWRARAFRENALQSKAEGGMFLFLTADAAHDEAISSVKRVGRATGRLTKRVDAIDASELTGDRLARHSLLQREAAAMLEAMRRSAKSIVAPKPVAAANLRIAK